MRQVAIPEKRHRLPPWRDLPAHYALVWARECDGFLFLVWVAGLSIIKRACIAANETYFPRMSVLETTNKESATPHATAAPRSENNFLEHPDKFPRRHI